MNTQPGPRLPSAKRGDGEITVSRIIQIPLVSIRLTGTLTEADRIYRLLVKSLSQNGYRLSRLTKTVPVLPGDDEPTPGKELAEAKRSMDKMVDESLELIAEIDTLRKVIAEKEREIRLLHLAKESLEEVLVNVTSSSE